MVAYACSECGKPCGGKLCRPCYRRSVGATAHVDRVCAHCGKVFRRPTRKPKGDGKPRDSGLYCDKPCYFAAIRAGRQRFRGRVFDLSARLGEWFCDWERQRPKGKVRNALKCLTCGSASVGRGHKWCNHECQLKWRGNRKCSCGTLIENASWCTTRCNTCKAKAKRLSRRATSNYRKRCRKYGGYFNGKCKRADILRRDNYICHVCKRKTLSYARLIAKGMSLHHPRGATIDHFPVPLSKGGDHDWDNVRCACRKCNVERGAKWDKQPRFRFV